MTEFDCQAPTIRALILHKARILFRAANPPFVDLDDLEQHLTLAVLAAAARYDAGRGCPEAYALTVLRGAVAQYRRDRKVRKRSGSVRPLDGSPPEDLHTERERERTDLRLDLEELMATLTPDERALARDLMSRTPSELARERQVPRSTLQGRVRALRKPFEKKKLHEFL